MQKHPRTKTMSLAALRYWQTLEYDFAAVRVCARGVASAGFRAATRRLPAGYVPPAPGCLQLVGLHRRFRAESRSCDSRALAQRPSQRVFPVLASGCPLDRARLESG